MEGREKKAVPPRNYRMRMGNDYRFHFEEKELRMKAGDDYVFEGNEPGFDNYMVKDKISTGKPV